jgi:hypothetical protein
MSKKQETKQISVTFEISEYREQKLRECARMLDISFEQLVGRIVQELGPIEQTHPDYFKDIGPEQLGSVIFWSNNFGPDGEIPDKRERYLAVKDVTYADFWKIMFEKDIRHVGKWIPYSLISHEDLKKSLSEDGA